MGHGRGKGSKSGWGCVNHSSYIVFPHYTQSCYLLWIICFCSWAAAETNNSFGVLMKQLLLPPLCLPLFINTIYQQHLPEYCVNPLKYVIFKWVVEGYLKLYRLFWHARTHFILLYHAQGKHLIYIKLCFGCRLKTNDLLIRFPLHI